MAQDDNETISDMKDENDRDVADDSPATFDEGESRSAPIERTGHDDVRSMPRPSPAPPNESNRKSGEDLDPHMTD